MIVRVGDGVLRTANEGSVLRGGRLCDGEPDDDGVGDPGVGGRGVGETSTLRLAKVSCGSSA